MERCRSVTAHIADVESRERKLERRSARFARCHFQERSVCYQVINHNRRAFGCLEMLTSQRRDQDLHALHQYQFYVLSKNAREGASDRYSLNGNQWLSAAFWIVLKNDLFQYAAGMWEVSRVEGACSHFAVALVRQLFCDSIKSKGPKESREKYRQQRDGKEAQSHPGQSRWFKPPWR